MIVRVYRNLNRRCWSIQACESGRGWRLLGHADGVRLAGVRWHASMAGAARVRRERRKNVHAFAQGELVWSRGGGAQPYSYGRQEKGPAESEALLLDGARRIEYSPYWSTPGFRCADGRHEVLRRSAGAEFLPDGSAWAGTWRLRGKTQESPQVRDGLGR